MKVCAISDLHGNLPVVPECDLLLIAGDICPFGRWDYAYQRQWLDNEFRRWLFDVPARQVVGVWGNHDAIAAERPDEVPDLPWRVLTDELLEWEGLRIYGLPWQARFGDWAFNLDEPDLDKKYAAIPECDIIVSHGPPYGCGDRTLSGQCVGSLAFLNKIAEIKPQLTVFGHIHEGRGVHDIMCGENWILCNVGIIANVAHVNVRYEPVHEVMEFAIAA